MGEGLQAEASKRRAKGAPSNKNGSEGDDPVAKLTKEMCHYWRKRDKEQADSKRKREKIDKEMKKRLQEEEENRMQRKRGCHSSILSGDGAPRSLKMRTPTPTTTTSYQTEVSIRKKLMTTMPQGR